MMSVPGPMGKRREVEVDSQIGGQRKLGKRVAGCGCSGMVLLGWTSEDGK